MTPNNRMWRSILGGARRAAAWPFRVAAARATLRALANMDRRELADIGLNPSDVRDVSTLPLDGDPTELLTRRVRERRGDAFAAPPTAWGGDRRAEDPRNEPRQNRPSPGPRSGSPRSLVA